MSEEVKKEEMSQQEKAKKVEEAINARVDTRIQYAENKMEYKQTFKSLDDRFKSLNDLDPNIVGEVKEKFSEFNNDSFVDFKKEVDSLQKIQDSVNKKLNEIEVAQPKFNAVSSSGLPQDANSLFDMKKNNQYIGDFKTEDGLVLTQNYIDQNEKITDALENLNSNIHSEADIDTIRQSSDELMASCRKTNKYFKII